MSTLFGRSSFTALILASRLLLSVSAPFADDVVIDESLTSESQEVSYEPEEEPALEEELAPEEEPAITENTEVSSEPEEVTENNESLDVVLDKLDQLLDKLDQVLDKMDQLLDKLDQNVSSSNEVMYAVIAGVGVIAGLMVFLLIFR